METRLERSKKEKKRKRIRKFKIVIVLIFFIFMVFGLTIVNEYIVELGYLNNSNMIGFDLRTKKLNLLGKTYKIDLKILKEVQ